MARSSALTGPGTMARTIDFIKMWEVKEECEWEDVAEEVELMEQEEADFKPDLYHLLDGVLPNTIDDWETEIEKAGPIINDLFLGSTKAAGHKLIVSPPLKEEPLSVVFVGTAESEVGYHADDYAFYHQPHFAEQHQYATGPSSSHHLTPSSSQSLVRFHQFSSQSPSHHLHCVPQQPSEPLSTFDECLAEIQDTQPPAYHPFGTRGSPAIESQTTQRHGYHYEVPESDTVYEPLSVEPSSLEDEERSTTLWQGMENVFIPSSSSSPSSSQSQEEILEEIQRECAEIEERHSPPSASQSPSTSRGPLTSPGTASKRSSRSPYAIESSSPHSTGDRKKELNRIAAIKYRERRRKERETTSGELKQLEDRNAELMADCASAEAEIKYLKKLIGEINARAAAS